MFVAQQRRKENIIEYLLYMWQVEDLIRANNLDIKKIEETAVSRYGITDKAQYQQVIDWWDNLCEMMRIEKKETSGHLQVCEGLINDIYNFHLWLLTQPEEIPYQNAFQTAYPDLQVLERKIPNSKDLHHIKLALTGIYNYFLLKLQGRTVLADTTNAIHRISHFLALLSQKYLKAERDLYEKKTTSEEGTFEAQS